jgi:hypothetical protein
MLRFSPLSPVLMDVFGYSDLMLVLVIKGGWGPCPGSLGSVSFLFSLVFPLVLMTVFGGYNLEPISVATMEAMGTPPQVSLVSLSLLGFVPGGGRAGSGTRGFLSVSMTVAESVWTRLREGVGRLRRDGSRGGSVGDRTEPS